MSWHSTAVSLPTSWTSGGMHTFSLPGRYELNTRHRGATPETVKKAFEILLADKNVKSIFINIFGGIMRCDYIAEGVIKATQELEMTIPLTVRLKGTKEAEAKQ
jgi:succinyl-CoA synthetase beta subunit